MIGNRCYFGLKNTIYKTFVITVRIYGPEAHVITRHRKVNTVADIQAKDTLNNS